MTRTGELLVVVGAQINVYCIMEKTSTGVPLTKKCTGFKMGSTFPVWSRRISSFARTWNGKDYEGNVLFNDPLSTFYVKLHGARHMVKDHSNSHRKPAGCR